MLFFSDKFQRLNLPFFSLDFFHESYSRKIFTLKGVLALKKYQFCFCIQTLIDHKCHNCLWYRLTLIFENMFLQNNWLDFSFQGFNLKLWCCFEIFRPKSLIWLRAVESWRIRKTKLRIFWTCMDIQSHIFFLLHLFFFHQRVNW